VKIVFITQQLDLAYLRAASAAGASAYVAKQSASTELVTAIHRAIESGYYVTPLAAIEVAQVVDPNRSQHPSDMFGGQLTPRQREVLRLIAEGKTSKEISITLNISVKTVEFHRNALIDELGVRTIAELTRFAVSRGIVNS
jgi:DNA-binding NarL/FixJ family response regulator